MSKLSPSKFCHRTQNSADGPIVQRRRSVRKIQSMGGGGASIVCESLATPMLCLLLSQHKQRLLGQTNLTCFIKNNCCAAIHGQI